MRLLGVCDFCDEKWQKIRWFLLAFFWVFVGGLLRVGGDLSVVPQAVCKSLSRF
jgi:hypothetical protein